MRFLRSCTLLLLLCLTAAGAWAQMSGTFTVHSGQAATAQNYRSLTAAVEDLSTGTRSDGGPVQGPGLSGPVTLRITDPNPLNEQVSFPLLSGSSAVNTLRITGGSVQYNAAGSSNRHVLRVDGARHLILDSLTLRNNSPVYSTGIHLTNEADSVQVLNCSIFVDSTVTTTRGHGIVAGAPNGTTGSAAHHCRIAGNRISGGYSGIHFTGTGGISGPSQYGNVLENNRITGMYAYGIYAEAQEDLTISGNVLDFKPGGYVLSRGILVQFVQTAEVRGNVVRGFENAGIFLNYCNFYPTGPPSRVWNNMVISGVQGNSPKGLYFSLGHTVQVWHNSVCIRAGAGLAFWSRLSRALDVRNNVLAMLGSAGGHAAYADSANNLSTIDYNLYYAPQAPNLVNIEEILYTAGSLTGPFGWNANSLTGDPMYLNPATDLHILTPSPAWETGFSGLGVSADLDGDARPLPPNPFPDMGCDEFTPVPVDAGVLRCLSPVTPFGPGTWPVLITLRNYGTDTLLTAQVHWQINGSPQTPYTWTGSLPPGTESAAFSPGTAVWNAGDRLDLLLYSLLPNGGMDQNPVNDTLALSLCTGLSGTFTVGSATADFAGLQAAIDQLACGGMSGPVTLRLDTALTEQVRIPAIPGASPSRLLRITGGPSRHPLRWAAGSAPRHTVRLEGAHDVILDSLDLYATGMTGGIALHITDSCRRITVQHSRLTTDTLTQVSGFVALLLSGNLLSDPDDYGGDILITDNAITGGWWNVLARGIPSSPAPRIHLQHNRLRHAWSTAAAFWAADSLTLSGNTVQLRPQGSAQSIGFRLETVQEAYLTGNVVAGFQAEGILLNGCNLQPLRAGSRLALWNQMLVSGAGSSGFCKGISLTGCDSVQVWHQSVSVEGPGAQALYAAGNTRMDIRNNALLSRNSATGTAAWLDGAGISALDYNHYHTSGSAGFLYLNGPYSPANYAGAGGWNLNSQHGDPQFVNAGTDLHAWGTALLDQGQIIPGVTVDVDGDLRSAAPEIGADEYGLYSSNTSLREILLQGGCVSCPALLGLVLRNEGLNAVSTVPVAWQQQGGSVFSGSLGSGLAPGQSDTLWVPGPDCGAGAALTAYCSLPADAFRNNDTARIFLHLRPAPVVQVTQGDTVCTGSNAMGVAVSGDSLRWLDTPAGPVLGQNDSLWHPVTVTDTVYAQAWREQAGMLGFPVFHQGVAAGAFCDLLPQQDLRLDSLRVRTDVTGPVLVRVYACTGSWVPVSGNAGAWSLLTVFSGVAQGSPAGVMVPLSYVIPAGALTGLYAEVQSGAAQVWLDGALTVQNADLHLVAGGTSGGNFGLAAGQRCPQWDLHYTVEDCPSAPVPVVFAAAFPPVAAFTMDTTLCPLVQFTGLSTGGYLLWDWDLGGGGSAVTAAPVWDYTAAGNGTYPVRLRVENACGVDSVVQNLEIDCLIGRETGTTAGLRVYPVPVSGDLHMDWPGQAFRWELVDLRGQVLRQGNGDEGAVEDVRGLAAGMYLLRVTAAGGQGVWRVQVN